MNQTAKYIHSALGQSFKPRQSFQELITRNQMIFQESPKRHLQRTLAFKPMMVVLTVVLCLFVGFIGFENIRYERYQNLDTSKVAHLLIQEGYIDRVIAFGPTDHREMFTVDQIIGTRFMKDSEALELRNYYKAMEPQWYIFQKSTHFNLHVGEKNQQDIIIITHLFIPSRVFIIDSPLDYSFRSIVEEFEALSGQVLSDDFLHNRYQESNPDIYSGISINIIQNKETQKIEIVYRSIIDGIEYEIRK